MYIDLASHSNVFFVVRSSLLGSFKHWMKVHPRFLQQALHPVSIVHDYDTLIRLGTYVRTIL